MRIGQGVFLQSIDAPFLETPLELAAKVSAKLNRTVTLGELLKNAQCPQKRTINNTLCVITGLIDEAVEDNENLRAKLLDKARQDTDSHTSTGQFVPGYLSLCYRSVNLPDKGESG